MQPVQKLLQPLPRLAHTLMARKQVLSGQLGVRAPGRGGCHQPIELTQALPRPAQPLLVLSSQALQPCSQPTVGHMQLLEGTTGPR